MRRFDQVHHGYRIDGLHEVSVEAGFACAPLVLLLTPAGLRNHDDLLASRSRVSGGTVSCLTDALKPALWFYT